MDSLKLMDQVVTELKKHWSEWEISVEPGYHAPDFVELILPTAAWRATRTKAKRGEAASTRTAKPMTSAGPSSASKRR